MCKPINQQQTNTHSVPKTQNKPLLYQSADSPKVSTSSSNNLTQPTSSGPDTVGYESSTSIAIGVRGLTHHEQSKPPEDLSNHPQYNQVLSQKFVEQQSSALTISNKNSVSLDEPSCILDGTSSSESRHSVPNVLNSGDNPSIPVPLSSSNYNYPNNISHLSTSQHQTITSAATSLQTTRNEIEPNMPRNYYNSNKCASSNLGGLSNSGSGIPQRKSDDLGINTNLHKSSGANDSGIIQPHKEDTKRDELQLKWEKIVGPKYIVVVSKTDRSNIR